MQFAPLPSSFYIQARKHLTDALKPGSIAIFHSNDKYSINADQYFPFRQNKDLLRLTGIYQENTVLVLFPDHPLKEKREILFISKASDHEKTWDGDTLSVSDIQDISGIQSVVDYAQFESIVFNLIPQAEYIYLNSNERAHYPTAIESKNERCGKYIISQFPYHKIERMQPVLKSLNLIKTQEEIEAIRLAIQLTGNTWNTIADLIRPGVFEFEIAAAISYEFERKGGIHAFHPIVASGSNACTLHYHANKSKIARDDVVLVDFGCELNGYAADMTRCKAADGVMNKRQFQVYDQVLNLYQTARQKIKPGITLHEINEHIKPYLLEAILQLGLETEANEKFIKKYMPHGVSHFLGGDVHDYGDRYTLLKPGMIVTCEPGLYIHNEAMGIRLENDLLITEHGNEDLMKGYDL